MGGQADTCYIITKSYLAPCRSLKFYKMATPPQYGDLGKSARDLFSKGFNYGAFKLDATQKSSSNVQFKVSGKSSHDAGNKVDGHLETKYECKEYGLKFVEKITTDSILGTEVTIEDQFAKGLKLVFDTTFTPHTGVKSGKLKTGYKQELVNVNVDVDFSGGPVVHGAAVLGHKGWLAGYQMAFDTTKSALTKNNFSLGYLGPDFTLHTDVKDGTEFTGSYHHKVSADLEAGGQLSWVSGSNATRLALAAAYKLDAQSKLRAKINNSLQIGLSLEHKLRPGVTLTLSSLIEGKAINAGGHKVGLGLELEN